MCQPDSEEKREPVRDIDTAVVDSLKVLDPNRPIREAEVGAQNDNVRSTPESGHQLTAVRCPLRARSGLAPAIAENNRAG